jgi:hypothetical protein
MGYAQLGDVTTPTGSEPGVFSQIWGWLTEPNPANAANEPANVQAWMAAVRTRGNAVVRYPKTDDIGVQGDLAEREKTAFGYSYYLAPDDVLQADYIVRGLSWAARPVGAAAAAAEAGAEAVQGGVKLVLQAPRDALSDITGISPKLITAGLVLGVGALIYGAVRKR